MDDRPGHSEHERAAAARRYRGGDSSLDQALSEVVALASRIAGTPVALIGVLDDRSERILAHHRWNIAEIEPARSFLPHLIAARSGPLTIFDAAVDERTRSNSLVTDKPGIRFYTGIPITTGDGLTIGALQVLDQQPRTLTAQQIDALGSLSRIAFRHLEDSRRLGELEQMQRDEEESRRALKESEERFRDLFESADDIIMTILPNGALFHLNQSGADHLGIAAGRRPKSVFDLVHYEDLPEFRETFSRVVKQADSESVETTFLSDYGKRLTVQGTLIPKIANGETALVRVIFRDITERKKTELELGKARDAALEASRAKTRFLTNMSHELRTPMNAIIGMTELLLASELDDEQRDLASTAFASAESLMTTLGNILHVSMAESGGLSVGTSDFDPRSMLERLALVTNLIAAESKCRLVVDIDENLPLVLRGDVTRVRQVLTNLLSNAIKFNPGCEVRVRARRISDTETHTIVRFEVVDNGSGIARDVVPKLFTPFSQADESYTRAHQGTGLGLAISKQLVELMGGVISLDTEEGEGSTFWFTLPFQRVSSDALALGSRKGGFPGLRVLLLDRSATSRKILTHHLASWKIETTSAASATEAIDALRSAPGDDPYRLLIFDHRLPNLRGIDLARDLSGDRSLEGLRLMMMVPMGEDVNDAELRQAGIDAVVAKPVDQTELFDRIAGLFAADMLAEPIEPMALPAVAPGADSEIDRIPAGIQILLAEDKLLNQKLTLTQLKQLGLTADVASNGSEALAAIDRKQYDVILMDCQMPVMDGYEATMRIREKEADGRKVHIIALTAHAMEGERERCIAAGMNDYLSKPTRQHELAAALKRSPTVVR